MDLCLYKVEGQLLHSIKFVFPWCQLAYIYHDTNHGQLSSLPTDTRGCLTSKHDFWPQHLSVISHLIGHKSMMDRLRVLPQFSQDVSYYEIYSKLIYCDTEKSVLVQALNSSSSGEMGG